MNGDRDWRKPFGHTPTGTYVVAGALPPGGVRRGASSAWHGAHGEGKPMDRLAGGFGTVFDVNVEDVDGTTLVTVEEGLVDVQNRTAAGTPVRLNPGEYITVFRNQQLAAAKPDKDGIIQAGFRLARDTFWQILRGQRASGGVSGPGGVPVGAQGDKGKGGTGTPGAPTTAPGAPTTPPGGH